MYFYRLHWGLINEWRRKTSHNPKLCSRLKRNDHLVSQLKINKKIKKLPRQTIVCKEENTGIWWLKDKAMLYPDFFKNDAKLFGRLAKQQPKESGGKKKMLFLWVNVNPFDQSWSNGFTLERLFVFRFRAKCGNLHAIAAQSHIAPAALMGFGSIIKP